MEQVSTGIAHLLSLWEWVREVFMAAWTAVQRPGAAARQALLPWLRDVCVAERRLAAQLRRDAMAMPYEAFRQRLTAMAHEDDHHASLLREHLEALSGGKAEGLSKPELPPDAQPPPPWRSLRLALADKRELYERYRQQASTTDDAALRALLLQLKQTEEMHQDQLVELLMKADGYVHSL